MTTAQESPKLKEALDTLTVGIKEAVKLWPTRMDDHDVDNLISEIINRLWRPGVCDERLAEAWDEGKEAGWDDSKKCHDLSQNPADPTPNPYRVEVKL